MTDHEDDEKREIDGIRELREGNRARKEEAETENIRREHPSDRKRTRMNE